MFRLTQLYTEYGKPNQIFLALKECSEPYNACDAFLYFVYDEYRFLSENLLYCTINDKVVSLCVSDYHFGYISMWASNVNIDLNSLNVTNSEFTPIEQKTQTQLYEFFSKSHNTNDLEICFDASVDLWK